MEQRHKTAVIFGTLTTINNYPKLRIYLNNASPYWQAVYWDRGITYRRSSKTKDKLEAISFAKVMYEQIIAKKYQSSSHAKEYPNIQIIKQQIEVNPKHSFKVIAEQWLSRKESIWVERHTFEVRRRLRNNLYDYIGNKHINSISKTELLSLIQKIEERGAVALARRLLNDCKHIWQFAIALDACKTNITSGLNIVLYVPVQKHQRAIDTSEFPNFVRAIYNNSINKPMLRYALICLALTFVRKRELMDATWSEFDLEKRIWKIPAERMKMRTEHIVPLSKMTLEILYTLRYEYPSTNYVFYKTNCNETLCNAELLNAVYKLGYRNKMTVHGFRAVASTILNENKFRADVIERQLAHIEGNKIRRAYNRAQYLEERVEMMEWWGEYIKKFIK